MVINLIKTLCRDLERVNLITSWRQQSCLPCLAICSEWQSFWEFWPVTRKWQLNSWNLKVSQELRPVNPCVLLVLHAIVSMVEVLGGGKAAVSSKTFCACTCCDPVWGASADWHWPLRTRLICGRGTLTFMSGSVVIPVVKLRTDGFIVKLCKTIHVLLTTPLHEHHEHVKMERGLDLFE